MRITSVLFNLLSSEKGAIADGLKTCLFIVVAIIVGITVIGLLFKLLGLLIMLAIIGGFIVGLLAVLRWLGRKTLE